MHSIASSTPIAFRRYARAADRLAHARDPCQAHTCKRHESHAHGKMHAAASHLPMRHGTGPGARGSLLTNVLGQLSPLVAYFRLVALRDQVRVCDKTRVQHDMRAVRGSKEIAAMCASLHGGRPYRSPSNAPLHGATRSVVSGQRGQHGLQAPPHGLHPRRTNGLMRERPGQALTKASERWHNSPYAWHRAFLLRTFRT
jgi:hypothetical protein